MKGILVCILTLLSARYVSLLSTNGLTFCNNQSTSVISFETPATSPGSTCRQVSANDWVCSDLQTALEAIGGVAEVGRAIFGSGSTSSLINSDCVVLVIPAGLHYITAPLHFGNISVQFIGAAESTTIYCNYTIEVDEERIYELDYEYPDYVMYFNRSMSVVFEGLEVVGCPYPFRLDTVTRASVKNSTFRYFAEAVFDIYNTPNITISDCSFLDNRGTGISRYPIRGNTGAVAIGYNNIPIQSIAPKAVVSQCNFTNNSATAESQFRTTNSAFFSQIFPGRGGALAVFYSESFNNVTVKISDNNFERNFARLYGAAVYLVLFGQNTQQLLVLEHNTFISNVALLGGAALVTTFISDGFVRAPHMLNVSDSIFFNNSGQTGGAVLITKVVGDTFVKFDNCKFILNHGMGTRKEYGAAIATALNDQYGNEKDSRYEFIDCLFEENFGINGIVAVDYTPVLFGGNTTFSRNKGTSSLTIISTLVDFSGDISFVNNSVGEEGALHLLSFGQFRLKSGTNMLFEGNRGRFGASILIDTPTATIAFDKLLFNPQCFALHEKNTLPPIEWNDVSVKFRANSAVLGSSIYIARLGTCSWFDLKPPFFKNTTLKLWPVWSFDNGSNNTGYSDPHNEEYQIETIAESIGTAQESVTAWPGQRFTITLTGLDQFEQRTTANARFLFNANSTLCNLSTFENVPYAVNIIPEVIIIDEGRNTPTLVENFTLTYAISAGELNSVTGPIGCVDIDAPFDSVKIKADSFALYPALCPAGYTLFSTRSGLQCQCNENVIQIILCEDDQDSIIIESGLWGTSTESATEFRHEMYFHPCPPGYCRCSQNSSLGKTKCATIYQNSDPDAQCVCNRAGVLCGGCRDGLGVSVLLNKCVSCRTSNVLLIIVLVLLDAVMFAVVVVADVPLPQWSYPFLFYIQISPYIALYFPESFEYVGNALHFISSATSFYFIYDFCLYGSMSPLVSYFLRYIPLIIALVLIPLAVLFRKKLKRWPMLVFAHHGLWWIVLLLYSHLVYTSMSILNCAILPPNKSPRWFVNGNIECFTGGHIPLAILAILVLAVSVALIPLTALISIKIHRKFIVILIIHWLHWLQHFVSPLTASFKEEWRWWSAVDLGRRFVLILFIIPFPKNYVIPLLMMCIILTLYGMVQPYKSQAANYFEILVQINIILLLSFPSTQLIKESLFTFSPLSYDNSALTNGTCNDELSSIAPLTWLLFPFYYLPLPGFVAVATTYLVMFLRKSMLTHRLKQLSFRKVKHEETLDDSIFVTVYHPLRDNVSVTVAKIELEESKHVEKVV